MRILISIMLFFWITIGSSQFGDPIGHKKGNQHNTFHQRPEFYVLDWKQGTKLTSSETGISIEIDSMGLQNVDLLRDKDGIPILYVSEISTPVCADGNCRLMDIKLYWTLLGDYAGFDRYAALPLTKHDHDEFLLDDYKKLHDLLTDNDSILKKRTINELVEKPDKAFENGVDALSGATVAEIKETVVSGALYSCYTAWHIVHGKIKGQLKQYTLSALNDNDNVTLGMLNSSNFNYQLFTLEQLDREDYYKYLQQILKIYKTGIPLVRSYIIKKLPVEFWNRKDLHDSLWMEFGSVDINSRSLLLDHLNSASLPVLESISGQLGVMTKNQLKIYLAHLEERDNFSSKIHQNLGIFAQSENEVNSYLVEEFLENYK